MPKSQGNKEAIAFANSTKVIEAECPQGVLNPGLYFGFLAGEKSRQDEITLKDQTIKELQEEIINLKTGVPANRATNNDFLSFEKLWEHNQGAMFLKEKYDSLAMKKSLADYFYRHGYQASQAEKDLHSENLSAIVRQMYRYAINREPRLACEKIAELFEKASHLLTKISPLRNDSE